MNGYARASVVLNDVAGMAGQLPAQESIARAIEEESRAADRYCRRTFFGQHGIRYAGSEWGRADPRELSVYGDLDIASLSAMAVDEDDDGTYETSLTEGTHYYLEPENRPDNEPGWLLRLEPRNTVLSSWPLRRRAVKLTGVFGYSYEIEATGATLAEDLDTSELVFNVDDANLFDVGDMLAIDSEQFCVTVRGGASITVQERGANGSTAAAHTTGTAIYRRRYPRPLERFVALAVVHYKWQVQTNEFGPVMAEEDAGGGGRLSGYYMERSRLLKDLRRVMPV